MSVFLDTKQLADEKALQDEKLNECEVGLRFICITYHKCLQFNVEENANKFFLI